jgi:hypothetical protein
VWVPDDGATENIHYNALNKLGLGEVRWFGAGTETDPHQARYSLDNGNTWVGEGLQWTAAVNALVAASGRKIDETEMRQALSDAAKQYCDGILSEYNSWINGETYGVVVYVIDRETGQQIEEEECWGHIGAKYAETTLEDQILSTVMRLGATVQ